MLCCAALPFLPAAPAARAGALEDYVGKPDTGFKWEQTGQQSSPDGTLTRLKLVSQQWREHPWTHDLVVVRPASPRNPHVAFLLISADGDGSDAVNLLQLVARRAGVLAAVITRVPNQPFYDGRREDALIAYTFDQYLKTQDASWPLLFPMVKSAVRAMDAVQAFAKQEFGQAIGGFVVSGASKRGWTTWLTAAADRRVVGIAPMVIDMLNMRQQLAWSEKVYGRQSEQIHDYTDVNLHLKMDDPVMRSLRGWVDPFEYRERYTMPKLLLLGTNDRYWTVDSLRHYWSSLPSPKLVLQTANAGHDLAGGRDAHPALAAFVQMIADREAQPTLKWQVKFEDGAKARVAVQITQPAGGFRLWTATSTDRDFRDETWASRDLESKNAGREAIADIERPAHGYRAFVVEASLVTAAGHPYKLSTEARVVPDTEP